MKIPIFFLVLLKGPMPRKHSRVRSKKSKKTTKKKSTRRSANSKIRGGGGVFSSAVGFLTPKLTDATIRRAVKDYLGDGVPRTVNGTGHLGQPPLRSAETPR